MTEKSIVLSEILDEEGIGYVNLFLDNLPYRQGVKFLALMEAVAVGAYNKALEDKDATAIVTEVAENQRDIPVIPNKDSLIQAAIDHVSSSND